jgi:hypothetical protein
MRVSIGGGSGLGIEGQTGTHAQLQAIRQIAGLRRSAGAGRRLAGGNSTVGATHIKGSRARRLLKLPARDVRVCAFRAEARPEQYSRPGAIADGLSPVTPSSTRTAPGIPDSADATPHPHRNGCYAAHRIQVLVMKGDDDGRHIWVIPTGPRVIGLALPGAHRTGISSNSDRSTGAVEATEGRDYAPSRRRPDRRCARRSWSPIQTGAPTCRSALFADINRPSFWRVVRRLSGRARSDRGPVRK